VDFVLSRVRFLEINRLRGARKREMRKKEKVEKFF
jgi:hypothetical protein